MTSSASSPDSRFESTHPRERDGRFTTKPLAEVDVTLAGNLTLPGWHRESMTGPTLRETAELVRARHAGQVDALGHDYFEGHLLPISDALRVFGERAQILGLLHDSVEDTDLELEDLARVGYDDEIVDGVDSMTRRTNPATGKKELYPRLIDRSRKHPLGRKGKIVDNRWNILLNAQLAKTDPRKAESLLHGRYLPARKRLLAGSGITGAQLHAIDVELYSHMARLGIAYQTPTGPAPTYTLKAA